METDLIQRVKQYSEVDAQQEVGSNTTMSEETFAVSR